MPQQQLPILIAVLATASVFMILMALVGLMGGMGRAGRIRKRMDTAAGMGGPELSAISLWGRKLGGLFSRLGEKMGPKDDEEISKGQMAMRQAGIRSRNAHVLFQSFKAALALGLAGVFLLLKLVAFPDLALQWTAVGTIFMALMGCYMPDMWLRSRTSKRKTQLMHELPDALDLLVVCVESGMGMDQALTRVSEELSLSAPYFCEELRTVTLELRAGKRRQDALRSLANRVGLDDLSSLVTLLIQADVFGISVARTLRVYSDTLRTKRYQRAEEQASKLPVKLLIPLICCILPALFVVIMGPAGIKLVDIFAKMNP